MANLDFIEGNCFGEERAVDIEESDIAEDRPAVTARRMIEVKSDECPDCPLLYTHCFPTVEIVREGQQRIFAVINPGTEDPRGMEGILV